MVEPIPLRGTSLHDGVAARLRSMVFERQLAPGQWIDEKALAKAWLVSRTPLREALKVLAAEGLVELVPQRGCRVIELSDDDADDLFPVMALLEGRCAHEAAAKASDADIAELQRLHEELERHAAAHDVDGYYRANHVFHSRVQALAANRWLDRTTGDLRKFLRLLRGRQLNLPGRIDASINEHRVLIDAFVQRDAARAERAMHDHLMAQLQALKQLRAIEQRHGSEPCWMNCARPRPGSAPTTSCAAWSFGCKRLLSERGETNSMAIARQLVERIDALPEEQLGGFFDYLSLQLSPDPQQVLQAAQAYAEQPEAQRLIALTQAAEPPRQELLRRLNRTPGGTATLVRMRRALLQRLPQPARADGAGSRPAAPVQLVVQPGLPADAAGGLELAGQAAGKDHPPRGGARHRRLGRPAPPAAARPALLCLLPPAAARRAADLRRGGAAAGDAARPSRR